MYHVPWFLFAVLGFFLWRHFNGHHHHHTDQRRAAGGSAPSSVMDH
jgi:hypothetical protein